MDEKLPPQEREPACVSTCPARARHFGDFADPESNVSKLVKKRGGTDLLPELGYQPTNKYLPPRRTTIPTTPAQAPTTRAKGVGTALLGLLDKALSR